MFSISAIKVVKVFRNLSYNLAVSTCVRIKQGVKFTIYKLLSIYNMVNLFALGLFLNQVKSYLNMVKQKLTPLRNNKTKVFFDT